MIITEHKKRFTRPEDIAEIIRTILSKESEFDQQKEHFWVLGVNVKKVIQYIELVSLGSLSESIVHPRETFRFAILKGVASIFIVHNHPSGDVEPSKEDMTIKERLTKAGEIIGIKLLDHIIIGNGNPCHKSFRDSGILYQS